MTLRPYQHANKESLRARFRAGQRRVIYQLSTGGGKCLGFDTPVLMYDGTIRPVQDIKDGDVLIGPDSLPRVVTSTCKGWGELFKITPTKGAPYVVNDCHILSLKKTGMLGARGVEKGEIVNVRVYDFLSRNATFRHVHKGWRAGVDFQPSPDLLAIDPYFLGVWLGDGTSRWPSITTGDPEVKEWLSWYAATLGCETVAAENSGNSEIIKIVDRQHHSTNPLLWALRHYRLIENKHVPLAFKRASREVRLQILAGIIDTDGHYDGKQFDVVLKNKVLAEDIVFIARSLGYAAYLKECLKTCVNNGVVGTYYRFNLSGALDEIPTKIQRKKASPRSQKKNPLVVGLKAEPIGQGDYYGFELAGPDRLFLLGDFTVTHNTVVACNMIAGARHLGHTVAVIVHRRELVQQFEAHLQAAGVEGVTVHMAQTLTRRLDRVAAPRLAVVDEAQHASATTWRRIIEAWPDTWFLGLTATPARTDGRGLGELFEGMVCGPPMRELIRDGYLARYRLFAPPAPDTTALRKRGGDYTPETLAAVFDRPGIVGDVVETYIKRGERRQFVAFGVTVDHARNIARGFAARGVACEVLHGGMSAADRDNIVSRVKCGALQGIANCDIISEGFDVPAIGCVILASKTASIVRYLQRVGRGLRPDGDREAIILDHGGNVFVHGMPDMHREWSLDGVVKRAAAESEVSIRHCGSCFAVYELPAAACPYCGAVPTPKARTLTVRKGELVEVDYWETAKVSEARSVEDLRQIAKARGYHPGWIAHKAREVLKLDDRAITDALGWHPAAVRRYGR